MVVIDFSEKLAVRAFERAGFQIISRKGKHVKMKHTSSGKLALIPHNKVKALTMRRIIIGAGLDPAMFVKQFC